MNSPQPAFHRRHSSPQLHAGNLHKAFGGGVLVETPRGQVAASLEFPFSVALGAAAGRRLS